VKTALLEASNQTRDNKAAKDVKQEAFRNQVLHHVQNAMGNIISLMLINHRVCSVVETSFQVIIRHVKPVALDINQIWHHYHVFHAQMDNIKMRLTKAHVKIV
jgi:hypothetical protein